MGDDQGAKPTSSMWGDMLGGMMGGGIGSLMKLINDPGLGANANRAMQAIVEMHFAAQRIEAKLDFLLRANGHDPRSIVAPAVPAGQPGRTGPTAVAGLIAHDGSGRASHAAVRDRDAGADDRRHDAGPAPHRDHGPGRHNGAARNGRARTDRGE